MPILYLCLAFRFVFGKKQTLPNMILDLSYIKFFLESFTRKYTFLTFKLLASGPEACNFIKKRLQYRCFPVNIAKFLRVPIMKNISERLLLDLKSAKCEKNLLCNNLQYSNICFARE